ncbi:hypothetical protein GQ53DRAFT_746640 [Thozetella sp. PMI_491]|nr:hypothetical protein GQ53DRAFT_746640 [Thozetella sp. PMI_491]
MFDREQGLTKALGPGHTLTIGTIHALGILYKRRGRLDEAAALSARHKLRESFKL